VPFGRIALNTYLSFRAGKAGRFTYIERSFLLRTGLKSIGSRLPMPKSISRRKTKKAVAKRFKITATGKVLRSQAGRRHLLASKSAKRKRHLAKSAVLDRTDEARVKENLPFH
jgi:large subunit ribosomal protein L35